MTWQAGQGWLYIIYEEASDNEPFELELKDGDKDNDVNVLSLLQEDKLLGILPDNIVME